LIRRNLALAIPPKPRSKPQPALTDLRKLRQLLVDCEAERCRAPTKFALRLLALTAVRPNEIHGARWEEFEDLDGPEPLAHSGLADEGRPRAQGRSRWRPSGAAGATGRGHREGDGGDQRGITLLFPTDRHFTKPMSENTLRALLIRAGYFQRHVPHGFRAAFSTIMNGRCERAWRAAGHHGLAPDRAIIDLMLAHVPTNKVESAYNRAAYMERRRELACEWADLLTADMWPPVHLGRPMRWAATGPGRPRG
jgi:integrase